MPVCRKIFFLSVGALACHFVALAVHPTVSSNPIEFVLVVVVTAACFEAAKVREVLDSDGFASV